jgi:hypothetical protein
VALIALILGTLAACATPGSVLTESAGALRVGIGAAREQSRLAFEGANKIARDQAIERKVGDGKLGLAEEDFPVAVAQVDADQWAAAFKVLDAYVGALQALVDPRLAQGTGAALQGLGQQLQNGQAIHAELPSGIAGVFASFGEALVQSHAEKTATDVMRKVTPQFSSVMAGMADAIGKDNKSDLRGTVHSNWQAALSGIRASFASIPVDDLDARRRVIQRFLDALNARDAQLASLDQLRTSLLALGEAHAAAGRGDSGGARSWIGRIDSGLDDVRRRTEEIEKSRLDAVQAREEAEAAEKEKAREQHK